MGEVLGLGREVRMLYMVRLSHPIGGWDAFGYNALHECRDSACRRSVEPRRGAGRRDLGTRARASMHKIQRVSSQSKRLRRSVEPRRDAGRRDLGARVRHQQRIAFHKQTECDSRTRQQVRTSPINQKTSPKSTRPKHREPNFLPAKAGALGGSSGRMREVWREKRRFCKAKSADSGFAALNSPPKGGPFSLQGLFSSIQAYTTRGDEDEGKD